MSLEFSRQEYWSGLSFSSPPRIFSTQESNLSLLHCRQILYWLSYEGIPNILLGQHQDAYLKVLSELYRDVFLNYNFIILSWYILCDDTGFPGGSVGKESTCNAGDLGSSSGLRRFPGGGHGNQLQYSCLENTHGQRSLAGCSPWDYKESETTEQLSTACYDTGNIHLMINSVPLSSTKILFRASWMPLILCRGWE